MKKIRRKTIYGYHFKKTNSKYEKYLKWKSIYKFDTAGQIKKHLFYWRTSMNKNMKLCARNFYTYDEKGNFISFESCDTKGRLASKEVYHYDELGRKTKTDACIHRVKPKEVERTTVLYKYDKIGNLILQKAIDDQGRYELHKYIYDEKNRLIEEKVRGSRYNDCDSVCEYTKSGSIRKYKNGRMGVKLTDTQNHTEIHKGYGPAGNLIQLIIYKFDKFGNKIYWEYTSFHCNCTGVHERPCSLEIIKYEYFR